MEKEEVTEIVHPCSDYMLVTKVEADDTVTAGGLMLPADVARKQDIAGKFRVHSCGPDVARCKAGDCVILDINVMGQSLWSGSKYFLIRDKDVVACLAP